VAGLVNTFGAGAMTNSIGEIRDVDFLFVIGSNTSEAHPIIAMEMKRAVRAGATLVVADPRAIWMSTIAHKHLQLAPGTDVWLLNAMAHVIIDEGLVDEEFVNKQTEGFASVRESVAAYTPEEAEKVTGIPAEDIRWTARRYAKTTKAGIYYTLGITEHSHGTDNVYALANLVLMTGHLGKPSAGMNPLRGQNNVQGANDAGATPVFYPGYQWVDDPEVRKKYERSWGVELSPDPGMNLNVMMKEVGKKIRGLFVMGEDIVLSEPNCMELEKGLNDCEFLVAQEPFLNETIRFADVVFPAAVFAEKEGTFTNSERRVQRVRKAVEPPGEARADWEILLQLAQACGADWSMDSAAEVYDELVRDAPSFKGISHARLDSVAAASAPGEKTGLQWPCPTPDHPGTVFLHEHGVLRGKGLFQSVEYRPSMELADEEYGLVLSTGRTLYHYNAATQTRRESGLVAKQAEAFVEIHPRDARKRGIADGERVEIRTRRGAIEVNAIISRQVRPGCIWMPLHFAEARANILTNDAGDPVTGTAEYKVCAAEVMRVAGQEAASAEYPGSYYSVQGPD
jgi:predicted molibdopterin-dependent oxidoreductase YjgC